MHDIIIRNAEIIDGTGAPAYRADVAIDGHLISDVGDLSQTRGKHVIDAQG